MTKRDELRPGQRLGLAQQRREGEAGPRHDHRPGLDAAVAVDALLQRERPDEVVHVVGARLGDQAGHLDRPGVGRNGLDVAPHVLERGELVKVGVPRRLGLGRQRPARVGEGGVAAAG